VEFFMLDYESFDYDLVEERSIETLCDPATIPVAARRARAVRV
jgi:hypothetical protein